MDKKKRALSYSAYSKYVTCPHSYKLHYIDKIRPEITPFHLIFGSAVDKALNAVLEKSEDESLTEMGRVFIEQVDFEEKDLYLQNVNGVAEKQLFKELRWLGWKGNNLNELSSALFNKRRRGEPLSENQEKALKQLLYWSGVSTVQIMVQRFKQHILPYIEEVVSVQRDVKRGIIDFEAKFKGIDGVVVCDNKTSSRPYRHDSVVSSVQLAGYGAEVGAYIVFNKSDKTGEYVPQLIIQKVPEHNREIVEQAYQDVESAIESGHFPRNLNACGKQFGKPCIYAGLCWENSMKGLKKNETK